MTKFLLWFSAGLFLFLNLVLLFIPRETVIVGCKPASMCYTETRGLTKTVYVKQQECPRGPR